MDRRTALALMGMTMLPAAPAAGAALPDFADPRERLLTYLRIRSRLDGSPAFVEYRGTVFGKIEGAKAVPLFDMEGIALVRVARGDDGRHRLDSVDAGYFLDRATGEPLDRWTNPLNGRDTVVRHYRSFGHLWVGESGIAPAAEGSQMPGAYFEASMGSPTVMGDRVWVHEDIVGDFASRPRDAFTDTLEYFGPRLTATSLATWCASLTDLADSSRKFVPATLAYQTIGSWRPFMRMGRTPGVISTRMFGSKHESLERTPADLRARILRDYPDFLTRVLQRDE